MSEELKMPPMGQTSNTLTILQWKRKPGERIEKGDVLVEVETDKATLEVESYLAGTLLEVLRSEGESVDVGDPIAVIGSEAELSLETGTREARSGKPESGAAVTGKEGGVKKGPPVVADSSRHPILVPGGRKPGPGKVLAAPAVRRFAAERGIDITVVPGTAASGRITKEDVVDFARRRESSSGAAKAAEDRTTVARRVSTAFSTIPHIYLTTSVDMSRARETMERARRQGKSHVTYTHIILRAVGRTVERHPRINSVWRSTGKPLTLDEANIGLVVAGDRQLVIATIAAPHTRSLAELSEEADSVVRRARSGKLRGRDLEPVAVSLSNLGMFAVESFQAIIDVDQCAMISVGAIGDRVLAIDGAIAIRPVMTVTIAADHRVVDGVDVARFLEDLKTEIETAGD